MKQDLDIKFKDFEKNGLPLVEAKIKLKNGYGIGYFILDCGSTNNQLCASMAEYLSDENLIPNSHEKVKGIGNTLDCVHYNLKFTLEDYEFEEKFAFNKDFDCSHVFSGYYIIGLLGSSFLWKNGLVLDYSILSLHVPFQKNVPCAEECLFRFPLGMGLKAWGVSILGICDNKDHCYSMIADSGCDKSLITQNCLKTGVFQYSETKGYRVSHGYNWNMEKAPVKEVSFNIINFGENNLPEKVGHQLEFIVISKPDCLLEKDDEVPICGLLGSDFLYKNKVIIDYSLFCIYSKKSA